MKLSAKVAYNMIIQVAGKISATALGLIAIALITRHLGKSGFGEYTTIVTFLAFFGIIADLGLTLVTVQMISQPGVNENKILNNLFGLRLASAIFLFSLAPLIVMFLPYSSAIKIGVAVSSLAFFFITLNQILVGLFQKKLKMDRVSIAEVISRIFLVAGVIMAIRLNYGLLGIMIAIVLANAANFILHLIFSRSYAKIKPEMDITIWREIIIKTWPLALTIIFNLIYLKADILILSLVKTQSDVGIYGATYKVIDVLITLPFMFAGITLPILTLSWAEKNYEKFNRVMQKSFDFMVILAAPMLIGTQFTAEKIMTSVAGREFLPSGPVLKILIAAATLIFLGTIFSHAIIAIDRQKKVIGAYIFTSLTALAGYIIFIPRYSYFGAAWVTIYSELVIALAAAIYVWKYTRFRPSFKLALKSISAALIMAIALHYFPSYNLILSLCVSAIIYFFFLYLFKGITKNDVLEILNK